MKTVEHNVFTRHTEWELAIALQSVIRAAVDPLMWLVNQAGDEGVRQDNVRYGLEGMGAAIKKYQRARRQSFYRARTKATDKGESERRGR